MDMAYKNAFIIYLFTITSASAFNFMVWPFLFLWRFNGFVWSWRFVADK